MTWEQLYNSTPREFQNRLIGARRARNADNQEAWSRARLIMYYVAAPYSKSIKGPKDVLPLPWDQKVLVAKKVLTAEQEKEWLRKFDKSFKHGGG